MKKKLIFLLSIGLISFQGVSQTLIKKTEEEKVIDKVRVISSEVEEFWMSLTEKQMQKLIDLKY